MIEKIQEISTSIKSSLDSLSKDRIGDKLEIEISELFGNYDSLRNIKLTLLEKDFYVSYYSLKEDLAKLKIINKIIINSNITTFIEELEKFILYFVEVRDIWKVIDWKYYYDIFDNEILLYSSRKALIKKIKIDNKYILSIQEEINNISKTQFEIKIQNKILTLKNEVTIIEKILDFQVLIEKIRNEAFNSFSDSLKYEWNNLIKENELTQAQLSIMAFITRTSIETSLRKHPLLIDTNIKMLGNFFYKLQENGYFVNEKEDIKQKLEPLNQLIHNNETIQITKDEIISIKNYFSSLFYNQNIDMPI